MADLRSARTVCTVPVGTEGPRQCVQRSGAPSLAKKIYLSSGTVVIERMVAVRAVARGMQQRTTTRQAEDRAAAS